jgi:RNA polymerase sigma-70 factor (ECF subfamily)
MDDHNQKHRIQNPLQWQSWSKLIAQIQAGNHDAYAQFLNEVGPIIYQYIRKRIFDSQQVGDIYQETLLKFHKAYHTYNPQQPLGPWLFAVVRNSMWDSLRKYKKQKEREFVLEIIPDTISVNKSFGWKEDLYEALCTLPKLNREAIELLKLEGLSLEEAAKILKISVAALKSRAHCGYILLRKMLKDRL